MGLAAFRFSSDLEPEYGGSGFTAVVANVGTTSLEQTATDGGIMLGNPASGSNSYANAIANNSYFTLTVTSAGNPLTLVGLGLDASGNASSARGFGVRSSIDGYSADIIDGTTALPTQGGVYTQFLRELSQDFSTSISLRFYVWGGFVGATIRFDNLVVAVAPAGTTIRRRGLIK